MSAALDTRERETSECNPNGLWGRSRVAPMLSGSRPAWCVVATYAKAERRAHAALHRFGFNAYLPLVTTRRRDRSWHTQPLWPGYVFVQLDLAKPWSPVKYAPGVFNLVSTNGIPAQCPPGVVEAIQEAEATRALYPSTQQLWRPGAPCRLASGPFHGCDAVVLKVGHDLATVALLMLGQLREVAVQLDCIVTRDG